MIRLIVLALAAAWITWQAAGVCIDNECFPDSPVSPVSPAAAQPVYLPLLYG